MSTFSNLLNPELLKRSNEKTVLTTHARAHRLWSLNELIPADTPSAVWIMARTPLALVWVLTWSRWDFIPEVGFWATELFSF